MLRLIYNQPGGIPAKLRKLQGGFSRVALQTTARVYNIILRQVCLMSYGNFIVIISVLYMARESSNEAA